MNAKIVAMITSSILSGLCATAALAQDQPKVQPFDQLQTTAPRAPFDQLQTTAPRAPFDQLQTTAPRSISSSGATDKAAEPARAPFDKIQDAAPRAPFDQIQDSAPRSSTPPATK